MVWGLEMCGKSVGGGANGLKFLKWQNLTFFLNFGPFLTIFALLPVWAF